MERMERPVGVTILAVLALIGGAMALLGALGTFAAGALTSGVTMQSAAIQSAMQNAVQSGQMTAQQAAQAGALTRSGGALSGLFVVLGIILLAQGALSLAFGIGALQLKPWAWILGIAAYGLGILSNVWQAINGSFGFGTLVGLALAAGILYYLFTPEVRRAFGQENTKLLT